jgi:hypothetical protein
MEAGYSVVGIDQSAGMLARAREHFPIEQFPMGFLCIIYNANHTTSR